ncbi:hypothetical protein [Pseudoalteromonas rubra]|uniref:Uncharacterized protein n=1 Tax=Pseudoalteromonas rubra TaxID=43658 RepID=A0A5S3WMZ5_9GAMM|nr:hypothetical protein [Pseudoalteromonas rubra]TMP29433.1 hypothetical protein CWB98_23580 [Pseudoalteromonas rubra]
MLRVFLIIFLLNAGFASSKEVLFSDSCTLVVPDKYKRNVHKGVIDYSYMGSDFQSKSIVFMKEGVDKVDLKKYNISKELNVRAKGLSFLLYSYPKNVPIEFQVKVVRIENENQVVELLGLEQDELISVLSHCIDDADLNLISTFFDYKL